MLKTDVSRLMNKVANLDVALDTFRDWLPTHGFKLVLPPPAAGGAPYALASVWRRGDAQVVSHKGATAALALLRAGESELVKLHDASAVAACTRCHGLCWFVTNAGTVEICRHQERAKILVG
jgi:cytochrome c553